MQSRDREEPGNRPSVNFILEYTAVINEGGEVILKLPHLSPHSMKSYANKQLYGTPTMRLHSPLVPFVKRKPSECRGCRYTVPCLEAV